MNEKRFAINLRQVSPSLAALEREDLPLGDSGLSPFAVGVDLDEEQLSRRLDKLATAKEPKQKKEDDYFAGRFKLGA